MIEKIDLFQKALHHRKVMHLENIRDDGYVGKMVMQDMNDKLSEVIDHVNFMESVLGQMPIGAFEAMKPVEKTPQKRTEAESEVLDRFVNPGETCLRISAKNVLSGSEHILGFDVVMVKQLDLETKDFEDVAQKAMQIAKKRVIIGIHASLLEPWKLFMARVPYHWENYEYQQPGNQMEYYIIDKLEGQEILAP